MCTDVRMLKKCLSHREILALWREFAPSRQLRFIALLAADLGEKKSCVRQWYHRGKIPPKHWPRLIVAVQRRFGIALAMQDLGAPPGDTAPPSDDSKSVEAA